jgi:hypothetical protein
MNDTQTPGTYRDVCEIDGCKNHQRSGWTLCLSHGMQLIEVWNR